MASSRLDLPAPLAPDDQVQARSRAQLDLGQAAQVADAEEGQLHAASRKRDRPGASRARVPGRGLRRRPVRAAAASPRGGCARGWPRGSGAEELPSRRLSSTVSSRRRRQGIQQVGDVEADRQAVDAWSRPRLLPAPLPARGCAQRSAAGPGETSSFTPRYFSFDRIAARCRAARSTSRSTRHFLVGADRDDRVVVGEAAVDQLGGEGHVLAAHAQVVAADLQLDLAVAAFEQALQLEHALARQDDLLAGLAPARQRRLRTAPADGRRWPRSAASSRAGPAAGR